MKKIFAIWWGEIGTGKHPDDVDPRVDKKLLEYCGKETPNIVFIPWYERDYDLYCQKFSSFFQTHFSLTPTCLETIYTETYEMIELENLLLWADIIYIWWGNTPKLVTFLQASWIDKILEAYTTWVVLSWVSSWAMCRFEYGISDGDSHADEEKSYQLIKWLWFISWICCPHLDSELGRKSVLEQAIKETGLKWYWIDDGEAIYLDENGMFQYFSK